MSVFSILACRAHHIHIVWTMQMHLIVMSWMRKRASSVCTLKMQSMQFLRRPIYSIDSSWLFMLQLNHSNQILWSVLEEHLLLAQQQAFQDRLNDSLFATRNAFTLVWRKRAIDVDGFNTNAQPYWCIQMGVRLYVHSYSFLWMQTVALNWLKNPTSKIMMDSEQAELHNFPLIMLRVDLCFTFSYGHHCQDQ